MLSFGLLADNNRKEKKELIESIKANYDSWMVKSEVDQITIDETDDSIASLQLTASTSNSLYISEAPVEKHIFSDFNFKICETQAVVRFQVDYKQISAFMEKKNGEWKLVCAAVIPPEL